MSKAVPPNVEVKHGKMPLAPAPVKGPWNACTVTMCERVYQDVSNVRIITGTFSKFSMELPVIPRDLDILPGPQAWVYIRLLTTNIRPMKWILVTRLRSWGGEPDDRATVIAKGDLTIGPDALEQGEFFFRYPSPGFNLTPKRKSLIQANKALEIGLQLELWVDDTFECAQQLAFTYKVGRVERDERSDEDGGVKADG